MTHLVACINENNTEDVEKIVSSKIFDKIYIITNQKLRFQKISMAEAKIINTDFSKPVEEIFSDIFVAMKKEFGNDKMTDLDIAVNISSGYGKEHTAILSALMKLGYGIRLISLDKNNDVVEL